MNREHELPSTDVLNRDLQSYESEFLEKVETFEIVLVEGCFDKLSDNFYHGIMTACFLSRPQENYREAAIKLRNHFYVQADVMWDQAESLNEEDRLFYRDEVGDLSLSGFAEFAHKNFISYSKKSLDLSLEPDERRKARLAADYYSGVDQAADIAQFLDDEAEQFT